MNIIDHELKRHELWQEELSKKKKADILLGWHLNPLLPFAISFGWVGWFCSFLFSFLKLLIALLGNNAGVCY